MYEVAQMVRAPAWGMQVLKVLGLNPTAVYWLLGLSATGVRRPACNWEQSRRSSLRTVRVIWRSDFNQKFFDADFSLQLAAESSRGPAVTIAEGVLLEENMNRLEIEGEARTVGEAIELLQEWVI